MLPVKNGMQTRNLERHKWATPALQVRSNPAVVPWELFQLLLGQAYTDAIAVCGLLVPMDEFVGIIVESFGNSSSLGGCPRPVCAGRCLWSSWAVILVIFRQ